jgi:uncharacterized protein YbaP (TraB family)
MRRILLALLFVLTPFAASAQDWSIETVVARPERGPLIWQVTRGSATVYLLGIVRPVPEKFAWKTTGISDVLKGAHRLIVPPQTSVGLAEGLWFLAWSSNSIYLPDDVPMESTLPDGLRKRFVAVRTRFYLDADRYAGLRVPLAALRLEGDVMRANALVREEPAKTVEQIARRLGVPSKVLADYEAIPMLKQLPKMSRAANEACMTSALDDIDALSVHARAAAEAWAVGDLDRVEAHYSEERFESCIQAMPSFGALVSRAISDSAAAVNAALNEPGKTVMIVSFGTLLRRDGLLDRLKAQGLKVEAL